MTSAKILIVEDEGVVAMDLSRAVTGWGHTVSSIAATAREALRSAAENRPDLVLMDIGLKGNMDGIQTAEALQDRYQLPVIYLTAFADKTTLERAKATKPYGYALKPFNERELRITIEMALDRYQADQALKSRGGPS
jgi:CheY-like chemotaxis protein